MASSASVGFRGREGMRWIIYEAFRRCQYECFRSSIELDRAWPYTAAAARLFFIEVGRVTGQVVIRRAVKRTILLTFAVAMFASPESWPRHPSGDDPIRVVLPPGVEIRSCKLEYFLVGVFGGYGGFARPKRDASEFEIETVHEGHAVEKLKAILYCSGYQIETMVLDSLPDVDGRNVQLHPKPLGAVSFHGVVRGLISQNVQVLHVDVDYTPTWICEFFRLPDCGLGSWRVASAELDSGGRFATTLPDFARDAVIRSFRNPGEFAFRIHDQKTGNPLFELKPAGRDSLLGRVAVGDGYPDEQLIDSVSPK